MGKYLSIIIFCGILLSANSANAALILNRPTYTGLNKGLVGYWSFDGKDVAGFPSTATTPGTVYDRSGQGNDGLYYNATGTKPVIGKLGQALSFDGVNDFVSLGNLTTLQITGPITISAWINSNSFTSIHGLRTIVEKGYDGINEGYFFRFNNNGDLEIGSYDGVSHLAAWTHGFELGTWHHIVGLWDGNAWILYADGLKKATTADSTGPLSTTIGAYIGVSNITLDLERYFTGLIDDVRIYNRALTADEIKRLYRIGGTLHVNSGDLGRNDTLQKGLVGYWSFDGADIAATSTGRAALDKSGNGITGYLSGTSAAPITVIGKIGQALDFNGDSRRQVGLGNPTALQLTGSMSISAWVNPYLQPAGQRLIIDRSAHNGSDEGWLMSYCGDCEGGTPKIEFRLSGDGIAASQRLSASTLQVKTWTHVVGVYNATAQTMDVYINGAIDNGTLIGTIPASQFNSSKNVLIGKNAAGGTNSFPGSIDEVRVYNRALTADEIKRLYRIGGTLHVNSGDLGKNDTLQKGLVGHWTFDGKDIAGFPSTATIPGTVYDRSGQGNNGLYYNATGTKPVIGKLGQALNFDGNNDHVAIGNLSTYDFPDTTFTATGWFRATAPDYGYFFAKRSDAVADGGWFVRMNTTGAINSSLVGSGGGSASAVTSVSYADGNWHHFAAINTSNTSAQSGNKINLYIDGAFNVAETPGTVVYASPTTHGLMIGAASNLSGSFFSGTIDDLRIYNRALSADEIKRLYNLGR